MSNDSAALYDHSPSRPRVLGWLAAIVLVGSVMTLSASASTNDDSSTATAAVDDPTVLAFDLPESSETSGSGDANFFDGKTQEARYLIDTGPLRIRDQFPLGIGFLGLDPVSAIVLDRGTWQVDAITTVTNTWAQSDIVEEALSARTSRQPFGRAELDALDAQDPAPGIYLLDAEMVRTAIAVRRGIGHGIQLELLIPLIDFSGGFLDSSVEGFHDAFGFEQAGRLGVERDGFLAAVRGASGSIFIDQDPGTRVGDIVVGAKFQLRQPNERRKYHLALETVAGYPRATKTA